MKRFSIKLSYLFLGIMIGLIIISQKPLYSSDIQKDHEEMVNKTRIESLNPLFAGNIEIDVLSPANNSEISNTTVISLEINCKNGSIYNKWYNWDNGQNQTLIGENITPNGLDEGNHTLFVYVNSTLGEIEQIQLQYLIDNSPPSIIISNFEEYAVVRNERKILVNITEQNTLIQVFYNWDGQSNFLLPLEDDFEIKTPELTAGNHLLHIFAQDEAGNRQHLEFPFIFEYNTPQLVEIDPNPTEIQTGTNISFEFMDDEHIHSIIYQWDDLNQNLIIVNQSSYKITLNTDIFMDGMHNVKFFVNDTAGNLLNIQNSVIIDNQRPNIILNDFDNNAEIQSGTIISFDIIEENTLNYTAFKWDDEIYTEITPNNQVEIIVPELNEGMHHLSLVTVDLAGNINQSTYSFNIDDTAPMISVITPTPNSFINTHTNISFSIEEGNTLQEVRYWWNEIGTITNVLAYYIELSVPLLSEGTQVFSIELLDAAGNVHLYNYNFYFDISGPSIQLISPAETKIGNVVELSIDDTHLVSEVYYNWNNTNNISLTFPYNIEVPTFPEGIINLNIFAHDNAGYINNRSFQLIIDEKSPIIEYNPEYNNSLMKAGQTIEFNISEENTLAKVWYSWNGTINYTLQAPYHLYITSEQQGNYNFTIFAEDIAGNVQSEAFSFVIDNSPPIIILYNETYIKNGKWLEFSIKDDYVLQKVNYSWDQGFVESLTSPYRIFCNNLLEGYHFLKIQAQDTVGNIQIRIFEILIDETSPEILFPEITETKPGNYHNISAFDDSPIFQVAIKWENQPDFIVLSNWWFIVPELEAGTHQLSIFIEDIPGNFQVRNYSIIIDKEAPYIELISPIEGSPIGEQTQIQLNITDEYNLSTVEFHWNNKPVTPLIYPFIIPYEEDRNGIQNLTVQVEDMAGNQRILIFQFIADLIPPEIILNNPNITKPGNILEFIIEDENNLEEIKYNWDGGWNQTFPNDYAIIVPELSQGCHLLHIYAYDTVENMQYVSFEIEIDISAPSITLISPLPNAVIHNGSEIQFIIEDEGGINNVFYGFNATPSHLMNLSQSIVVNFSDNGLIIVYIKAFDLANNSVTNSWQFVLDNSAPIIELVSQNQVQPNASLDFITIEANEISYIQFKWNLDEYHYIIQNLNQFSLIVPDLGEGPHMLFFLVADNISNIQEMNFTIYLDLTPPNISLLSKNITKPGNILAFQIFETYDLANLQYSWNNQTLLALGLNETFNIRVPLLSEGIHTIQFFISDQAGNHRNQCIKLIIDVQSPAISVIFPNHGYLVKPGDAINISVNDDIYIENVWLNIDNSTNLSLAYPFSYNIPELETGHHVMIVCANDSAGNLQVCEIMFEIDNDSPVIYLENYEEVLICQSNTSLEFDIDEIHLGSCYYLWDNGTLLNSWDPTQPIYQITGDGRHDLTIICYDLAGNSVTQTFSTTTDDTPPQIIIGSEDVGYRVKKGTEIQILVMDNTLIKQIYYNWDKQTNQSLPLSQIVGIPSKSGKHTIYIYAQDAAGNWVMTSFEFKTKLSAWQVGGIISINIFALITTSTVFLWKRKKKRDEDKILKEWLISQGFQLKS